MDATKNKISLPHPKKNQVLESSARQAEIQLARGNYDAVREIVDRAQREVEDYAIRLDDHVTALHFDTRLTGWLELHGCSTVGKVLDLNKLVIDAPRFEKHWWDAIREVQQQVEERLYGDLGFANEPIRG